MKRLLQIASTHTFRQSAITIVSTFAMAFLGAVFYLLVARLVGTREYGLFSVCLTIATILITVSDVGMGQGIVRFVAEHSQNDKYFPYANLALRIKVVIGTTLGLLLWIFSKPVAELILHQPDVARFLPLVGLATIGVLLFGYSIAIFQGLQKFFLWGALQVGANLSRLILMGGLLIFIKLNTFWALLLFAFAPLFGFLVSWFWLPLKIFVSKISSTHIREFWSFNKWTAAFTIASSIVSRLDIILTTRFSNLSQVGIYGLATTMASFLPQLSGAIGAVTAPKFASFSDINHSRQYLKKAVMFSLGISLVVALTMIPTAMVVIWFTGKDFSNALFPFLILLLSLTIFTSLSPVRDSILYYHHRPQFFFWANLAQAIVLIVVSYLLIPSFGVIGTAWAVFLGQLFLGVLCIYYYLSLLV